ncbi:MAG: PocR ligand-binding domain-containing protein [Spirochaetaceae bacterium]|jgi:ligand-binding sensor protein|nr:PocR ligand-binding domain-containing protein [Spirochaetaceae bacterium]
MNNSMGLFFDEEVQGLIDSFAYCFKVKVTVFSSDMEELIVGLHNPGSEYCRLIQKKLNLRYRCVRQDKMMCELCQKELRQQIYSCHAGFTEVTLPLIIQGTLIGYAMLGQFRTIEEIPADILNAWRTAGLDDAELIDTFSAQPYFDEPRLDNMLRLFSVLIDSIISQEHIVMRQMNLTQRVIQWVEDHIDKPITLDAVAKEVFASRSSVSHTIKKSLGMSFSQLCALKKIQRFESIVMADPDITIQEVSRMIGYKDPLYFFEDLQETKAQQPI